jgi:hypothetical protein
MNRWLLVVFLFALPLPSMAGANPFLVTLLPRASRPAHRAGYIPVRIDEQVAARATATVPGGSLWVALPDGAVRLIYSKSIIHKDGTWTWIGVLSDALNAPKAVITFGDGAVFGTIPTSSGQSYVVTTLQGNVWLTDSREARTAAKARSPATSRPPGTATHAQRALPVVVAATATPVAATPVSPATVDVLMVYTPEFVAQFSSPSAATAFIEYQIDKTNEAFSDSQVYGKLRLVATAQTTIPDDENAADALSDLRQDGTVATLRQRYGADTVVMAESTVGGCRGAYIQLGGNLTPIPPGPSSPAYLVWGDDGTGACDEGIPGYGLAQMLGSTFGLAQEPNLPYPFGGPGAYTFSYAYQKPGTSEPSEGTLEVSGVPVWPYFSNPNINLCDGGPCGVAGQSDAAQSLNLTLPIIATFSPTKDAPFNDVDGDGRADLVWRSSSGGQYGGGQLAYWIMVGAQLTSSRAFPQYAGRNPIATGDFNGDGYMDAMWSDGTYMWMWVGDGSSFTDVYMRPYPAGWTLVGTADLDGDGNADLIWTNGNQIAEWLMDGVGFRASYRQTLATGWRYIGAGDFDGDGQADLLLTNGTAMQMWTHFFDGTFASATTHAYPAGWTLLDTGDVDGDGMSDLLWRDNSRTRFAYWTMSGPQLVKSWSVAVTPEWTMGTSGDFDGDGLLDLIWYNGSQIVMWPGNSNGIYKGVVIHPYPTGGWTMLQ